jgi:hypothetical protein
MSSYGVPSITFANAGNKNSAHSTESMILAGCFCAHSELALCLRDQDLGDLARAAMPTNDRKSRCIAECVLSQLQRFSYCEQVQQENRIYS